jgi:hypothetical protein
MKGGTVGTAECHIGPRGQKTLKDAYMGMAVYASNAFDPSTPYATVNVTQNVDEIHFTEHSGGFGRGGPVGPPAAARDVAFEGSRDRVKARGKERQAAMVAQDQQLPGDSADIHGTGLSSAYGGDLLHQGQGGAVDGVAGDQGGGMVYVQGMGYMNPDQIPPELMQKIMQREQQMEQAGVQQQRGPESPYPNYDSQGRARAVDGDDQLPPIRIPRRESAQTGIGALTTPEIYVVGFLCKYCKMTKPRAEYCARPIFILLLSSMVFMAMYVYRKRGGNGKKRPSFQRFR